MRVQVKLVAMLCAQFARRAPHHTHRRPFESRGAVSFWVFVCRMLVLIRSAPTAAQQLTAPFQGLGFAQASGVSADGLTAVGWGPNSAGRTEALRWVAGAVAGIGFLPGASFSKAQGSNRDGSVVVGMSYYSYGGAPNYSYEAFRWSAG